MIIRLFHADKTVGQDLADAVGPQRGLVLATQMQGVRDLRFEGRTPFKEILECAGAALDVVAIIDEGRPEGMWRDPFGDLCERLYPTRREASEATSGYVLMRYGRALAFFRKALWDPLEDAEAITEYLSRVVPGLKPYVRPKPKSAEPPPRPRKPPPKKTPIINPATGRVDPQAAATEAEIPSVVIAPELFDDEPTASGPPPMAEPPPVDAYLVLGLHRGVGLDEAKKAWRALMQQYHPDKVAHLAPEFRELAEKRSRELNEAWALLEKELAGKKP